MQDTTFEMEKRRNRPEKYNRELVHKTVKAMERISEVRSSLCHNCGQPAVLLWCSELSSTANLHTHALCLFTKQVQCGLRAAEAHRTVCLYIPEDPQGLVCMLESLARLHHQNMASTHLHLLALQVRQKRQDRFHEARMRKAKQQQARLYTPTVSRNPSVSSMLLFR